MQPNVSAQPVSPMMQGRERSLDAAKNLADTFGSVTDQWREANDVMEYTKFKANAETQIALIKSAAEGDPDENNELTHIKSLESLKKTLPTGISNKMVEQKIQAELGSMVTIAGIDIESSFQKKKLLTNEIKLDENVKLISQKRYSANTPDAKLAADKEMMDLITANVNSGTITQAGGRKRLDDYRLGHVDLSIMNDAALSKEESYVYQQLKAGKDGDYPDMSDAERADRLEKAELHIRRNKAMSDYGTAVNQDTNEKDLLNKHGTNEVTETDVKNLLISTGVRKDFGDKYLKSIYELPALQTEYAAYNKIKMMQLQGKSEKEINRAVIDNIGLLTTDDKSKLLGSSYNALDRKTIILKSSAEALKNWAEKSFPSLILGEAQTNEVLYNFLQRAEASPDANIDEIMQGVQKDYIKKFYPDTTMLPDVPNIIGNRNKIQKVYERESKAKGKKADMKPLNPVTQTMNVDFDAL
jgi:hypothetical protein